MKSQKGFTLLELLVVVGIIALLALVAIVALDPLRQFAESRNARRWADVNNISTAIYRYIIENDSIPPGVDSTERQIGTSGSGCGNLCVGAASACLDLSNELKPYLDTIPSDPKDGSEEQTYYSVLINNDNVVTVTACNAENDLNIQISR